MWYLIFQWELVFQMIAAARKIIRHWLLNKCIKNLLFCYFASTLDYSEFFKLFDSSSVFFLTCVIYLVLFWLYLILKWYFDSLTLIMWFDSTWSLQCYFDSIWLLWYFDPLTLIVGFFYSYFDWVTFSVILSLFILNFGSIEVCSHL